MCAPNIKNLIKMQIIIRNSFFLNTVLIADSGIKQSNLYYFLQSAGSETLKQSMVQTTQYDIISTIFSLLIYTLAIFLVYFRIPFYLYL